MPGRADSLSNRKQLFPHDMGITLLATLRLLFVFQMHLLFLGAIDNDLYMNYIHFMIHIAIDNTLTMAVMKKWEYDECIWSEGFWETTFPVPSPPKQTKHSQLQLFTTSWTLSHFLLHQQPTEHLVSDLYTPTPTLSLHLNEIDNTPHFLFFLATDNPGLLMLQ